MTGRRVASHMTTSRLVTVSVVGLLAAVSCQRDPAPSAARLSAVNQPGAVAVPPQGDTTLSRLRARLVARPSLLNSGDSSAAAPASLLAAGLASSFHAGAGTISPAF